MLSLRSCDLVLPQPTRTAMQAAFVLQAARLFNCDHDTYPTPDGDPNLIAAIEAMTPHWTGQTLITNSATEALYLALSLSGPRLAVQVPAFFGVFRQARQLGLTVLPWSTPAELDAIGRFDTILLGNDPASTKFFTEDEKIQISSLARAYDALIIDDSPYDPLWFDTPPVAMSPSSDNVIRIGSLSKMTSPKFRLGYLRAGEDLFKKLRSRKITINLSSPSDTQAIAAIILTPYFIEMLRTELRHRAELLCAAIKEKLGVSLAMPAGGPYLNLPLPDDADPHAFAKSCADIGLLIDTNEHYFADGITRPYVRLCYGAMHSDDIPRAAGIMAAVLHKTSAIVCTPTTVAGRFIVVTGGRAKETLDGVRHIANHARPEDHGHRAAEALAAAGATVILIACKTSAPAPANVTVISTKSDGFPVISSNDLNTTVLAFLRANTNKIDIVLHLANIPTLMPAQRSKQKIKKKADAFSLHVVANSEIIPQINRITDNSLPICGYFNSQVFYRHGSLPKSWESWVTGLLDLKASFPTAAQGYTKRIGSDLQNYSAIVTSGPTVEPLTRTGDILTNFSSGRQGHAIAMALADRGADVLLVTGPTNLPDPDHNAIQTIHVKSAVEMLKYCRRSNRPDIFVGVAAVADFRSQLVFGEITLSILSQYDETKLKFVNNPDILATFGHMTENRPGFVIGFAAETNDLKANAQQKRVAKNADLILGNLVGEPMINQNSNQNQVLLLSPDLCKEIGPFTKYEIGHAIADFIVDQREFKQ